MIKPIETKYKGYRFRSRLEARWAVFFDALGLTWDYEREGYDLGAAGWYLPDFCVAAARPHNGWPFDCGCSDPCALLECWSGRMHRINTLEGYLLKEPEKYWADEDRLEQHDWSRHFWIEVKASKPTAEEITKLRELTQQTNDPGLFIYGDPWPGECWIWPIIGDSAWVPLRVDHESRFHTMCWLFSWGRFKNTMIDYGDLHYVNVIDERTGKWCDSSCDRKTIDLIKQAFTAARSARFEHGETP